MIIIDKVQQIKEARMTPEERYFLGLFRIMKEVKLDLFPDSIFYIIKNIILFEQINNTKTINVSLRLLLKIESKYGDNSMILFVNSVKTYLSGTDYCHIVNNIDERFATIESYMNIQNFKKVVYNDEGKDIENKIE